MLDLIIDPGHGGKDPGGGSNQFWKEKDMVLDISLYQYKRFKELGVSVALTRDKDVYIGPEERTKIVRESGAKDCISNHINAGGGDGAETIHSIYSEGHLAKALAEEIRKCGQNVRRVFTRTLPYDNKKDYYYMHRDTGKANTVIVEYGFADSKLDDIEQVKAHWKEYAEAVVKAYCERKGHKYVAPIEKATKETPPINDIDGHWAEESLKKIKQTGAMVGYPDGSMKPNESLTRAQISVILNKLGVLDEFLAKKGLLP